MFGNRAHGGDHWSLLEGIGPNGLGGDLTGDDHNRYRVSHAIGDRRYSIGRAWSRGDYTDAHTATGTGIARRHKTCALLIRGDDKIDLPFRGVLLHHVIAENGVIGGKDGTTTVAKDGIDTFLCQDLQNNIRATHGLTGQGRERGRGRGLLLTHERLNINAKWA